MFFFLLLLLLVAVVVHGKVAGYEQRQQFFELGVVYLLAGYCGLVMIGVSVWAYFNPQGGANMVGAEAGNPFQDFFLVSYFGMSVMATLSIWWRESYLIACSVCWSIYWFGATVLHMIEYAGTGGLSPMSALIIFGTHGLVGLLLLVFLVLSKRDGAKRSVMSA